MSDKNSIESGERLRDEGMGLAADRQPDRITAGRAAMLRALLDSADGTAAIDDATPPSEIATGYADGGCWRGTVTRSLAGDGYTELTGEYRRSGRPTRHRSPVAVWRLTDRAAASRHLAYLTAALAAQEATPSAGTDGAAKSETPKHETPSKQGNLNDESI